MENETNILQTKTGEKEQPKTTVGPAKVKIASVVIKDKDKDGKKMTTPLAQFMVKHPDKEELILISKIKFLQGEKLVAKGFWVQLDEDNKFYKGSTIDLILKCLKCETLEDTYGKEIDTVEENENSPYLCLKAY